MDFHVRNVLRKMLVPQNLHILCSSGASEVGAGKDPLLGCTNSGLGSFTWGLGKGFICPMAMKEICTFVI